MNELVHMDDTQLPRRYGLVPESMKEAMELARMMASAKLVPKDLQQSPADCLMVIQQAIRWDMDPFAVAQECSVIQGRLMHTGKLVAAVVNARGNLTRRLSFDYRGEGDDRTITVSGQLQGEDEPRIVEVIFRNARTPNQQWQKQPDQQLAYHGARVWARRHAPELMLGVYSPEEFDDAPAPRQQRSFTAGGGGGFGDPHDPPHDPVTGVIHEPDRTPTAEELINPSADKLLARDLSHDVLLTLRDEARDCAEVGRDAFNRFCKERLTKPQYDALKPYLLSLKPIVDKAGP